MKQWWNRLSQHETGWIRAMKHVESRWISNETICFVVVKHRETWWIRMKHGHETPWIRMKRCFMAMKHLESGWNSLFHGHETRCFMPMKHLESGTMTTEISIFYIEFWFIVFHCAVSCCVIAVSCCFIAVSCCFIAVSLLFHCCFTVFHRSVSWCFKVFHCPVSSCFMTMKQVQWERAFSVCLLPFAQTRCQKIQLWKYLLLSIRAFPIAWRKYPSTPWPWPSFSKQKF